MKVKKIIILIFLIKLFLILSPILSKKYPIKKIPATKPYSAALIPKSAFIVNAAYPTLTLSNKQKKYNITKYGIRRTFTLLMVCLSKIAPCIHNTLSMYQHRNREPNAIIPPSPCNQQAAVHENTHEHLNP